MTEQDRFLARFRQLRTEGLTDMKLYVAPGEWSPDQLVSAINEVDAAIQAGKTRLVTSWDRDVAPLPSALLA
jgi:hypothetical protein